MLLEVKDIHKSFAEKEVLHGISFSVSSGKALGLLGRNGAGKTTTIRIIMDVFKANSGEIYMDGKPFVAEKCKIGYLPEERGLFPKKTVIEQLVYLGCLRGISKSEAKRNARMWLERLEVAEYEKRKLETLSKGNQQKIQLAQTLVCNPEIIILDEPFSGLDPVNSQILKDVIKELIQEKKIVIFSSHQMSYVEEFCEDIVIINKGDVVLSGKLKEIKKDFSDNKLILRSANYSLESLNKKCQSELQEVVSIHGVKDENLLLQLKNNASMKMVMKFIADSDIEVEHFGVYEPSLTDIFVWKAGD